MRIYQQLDLQCIPWLIQIVFRALKSMIFKDKSDLPKLRLEKELEIEKQQNQNETEISHFSELILQQKGLMNARQEEQSIADQNESFLNHKNQLFFEMPANIKMFLKFFLSQTEHELIKKKDSTELKQKEPVNGAPTNNCTEAAVRKQTTSSTVRFQNPKLERLRINFESSLKAPLSEIEYSNPTTSELQPTLSLLKKSIRTPLKRNKLKGPPIIYSQKWKQMQAMLKQLCDTKVYNEIYKRFRKLVNDLITKADKEEVMQELQQFYHEIFPENQDASRGIENNFDNKENQFQSSLQNSLLEELQELPKQQSSFKPFSKESKDGVETDVPNYCQLISQCYDQNKGHNTLKIFEEGNLGSQKLETKKVPLVLIKNNETI